jgi:hypothetical protein
MNRIEIINRIGIFSRAAIGALILSGLLFCCGSATAQTTATYIGPNNGNWSNPANWDIGVVPINNGGNTYNVIVPANKIVTFDLGTSINVSGLSLQSTGRINVNNGGSVNVIGFTLVAGYISSVGVGSQFNAVSPLAGFSPTPQLSATSGGSISIAAPVYQLTGGALDDINLLIADGANSSLNLGGVTLFNDSTETGIFGGSGKLVRASNGGLIDLSGVQEIRSGFGYYNNSLYFQIQSGGNIRLDSLQTIGTNGNNNGATRFSIDVPSYSLPSLTVTNQAEFSVSSNCTLNLPSLTNFQNSWLNLNQPNSSVVAPLMSNISGSTITLDGNSTLTAPSFSFIQNANCM